MVNYCSVPQCNGSGGYLFPKDKHLRKKWQVAIRRSTKTKGLWKPSLHSVVCKEHFKESDFKERNTLGFASTRQKLKDGVVPSIFLFNSTNSPKSDERQKRQERRAAIADQQLEELSTDEEGEEIEVGNIDLEFAMEVEITDMNNEENDPESDPEIEQPKAENVGVQVNMPSIGCLRLNQFENNPTAINYYTGFKDIGHLRFFFDCLGPAAFSLNYKSRKLIEEDELFLCLMKLRLNKGKVFKNLVYSKTDGHIKT